MLAAARYGDASLGERTTERGEVDILAGGLHVEQAVDEVHALAVLQDVPGEGLMEDGVVVTKVVEGAAGFRERGVLLLDQSVRPHGQLGVVGQLVPVLVGRRIRGEIAVAHGSLESGPPVRTVPVRHLE